VIVTNIHELTAAYDQLQAGDVVNTRIVSKQLKQTILIDLLERGVTLCPSALSQVLNGSKTAQGLLLKEWMIPETRVIQRRADLMKAVQAYHQKGIQPVVTKADKMHCGYGIRLWETMEMLYSFIAFSEDEYPFLLQPFLKNIIDVRVIVAGDYSEAYIRRNPDNFRKNISTGGSSVAYELDPEKEAMCRAVMARARFPFAHIDLHITPDGACYLSEIALNGGIQGAKIKRSALDRRKQAVIDQLIRTYLKII
jgi:glutathione synthase/RimK-type ligase-like ATP-grasp enzyme